jgi:hypothetical protein
MSTSKPTAEEIEDLCLVLRKAVRYLASSDEPLLDRLKTVSANLLVANSECLTRLLDDKSDRFWDAMRNLDTIPKEALPKLAELIVLYEEEARLDLEDAHDTD